MIARLAAAAAAALLLVACGDGDDGRYDARVDEVRDAVEAGDRDAALTSLDRLGTEAFAAHAEGEVSDDELAELAGLVEQARAQVDDELPAPTTTTEATTTTAAPSTAPAPVLDGSADSESGEKKGNGKGEKRGKGRRGDDGGDDDD